MLFTIYMSKLLLPPDRLSIVTNTDDIILMTSNAKVVELQSQIKPHLGELHSWHTNRNLQLSGDKSFSTIFTTWTKALSFYTKHEINLPIPLKSKPKRLGEVFDGLLSFNEHVKTITDKLQKRINVIKKVVQQ